MAVDRHRDRRLGDADFGPRGVTDDAHLRVLLALLDLADIEDGETGAGAEVGDVGDVQTSPIVADVHAVAEPLRPEPDGYGSARVGDVEGGDRVPSRPAHPEGVAVGRERPLVTEDAEWRARLQGWVQTVLADVIDIDETGKRCRVAHVGGEQAAFDVQVERLVGRDHGRSRQSRRLLGMGGV